MAIKRRLILLGAFFAALLLTLGLCLFGLNMQEASALTYSTAKYLTNGKTIYGTTMATGCPSNFKIYMYGSGTTGASSTLSQGAVLDWSTFNITVETSAVSDHRTFQLLRNGSTYTSKSLSGSGNQTLFSGSLSDGMYELQYSCRYASSFLVDFTYYFYTFQFEVDKSAPTNSLKAGGATISSGTYTNKQIVYTASDANSDYIKYKKPNSSSYTTYYSDSYTVPATDANNGRWYCF